VLIAVGAFYLSVFGWQYNTAIWVLVVAAPLVPLLDRFFQAQRFDWNKQTSSSPAWFTHFPLHHSQKG
jgi:hypothetical protein